MDFCLKFGAPAGSSGVARVFRRGGCLGCGCNVEAMGVLRLATTLRRRGCVGDGSNGEEMGGD